MKLIYFIHQFFPRHIGGTEVYTLGLAQAAMSAGHEVSVLSYHESASGNTSDYGIRKAMFQGIPVYELHFNLSRAGHPARAEFDNDFAREQIQGLLTDLEPDLVHVMHAMKLSGSALQACDELHIPFIVTLCDFWFLCPRHTLLRWDKQLCSGPSDIAHCLKCVNEVHGFAQDPLIQLPHRALRRRIRFEPFVRFWASSGFCDDVKAIGDRAAFLRSQVQKAKQVIALSEFQKDIFVQNAYPADVIKVIPHGVAATSSPSKPRKDGQKLRLLFIGSLVWWKGCHILIEALKSQAVTFPFELKIYGEAPEGSPYRDELLQCAADEPGIRFMGVFPPEQIGELLAEADALLVPSIWYENQPLVIKAGLQAGVPVVASRIGSIPEMIEEGRDGLLPQAGGVESWRAALEEVSLRVQGLAPPFLPATELHARGITSIEANAEQLLQIYETIARTQEKQI